MMLLLVGLDARAQVQGRPELTPQELEWIAAHPVIDVGILAGNHYPVEAWVAGAPEGIGVDYAKLLAGRVGLRLQFHSFTDWNAIAYGDSGKAVPFDLLVGQPYGRSKQLAYLTPYVESLSVLVARKGDLKILSEDDLAHGRIAVERVGKYYSKAIKDRFPEATLIFAEDGRQALDMVAQGTADAYIGPSGHTRWLITEREQDDLSTLQRLPDLGTVQISLAVPRDRTALVSILRKAEATVSADQLDALQRQWGLDRDINAPLPHGRGLSDADRHWLEHLGTLRVGYETDRYPYSFISKDGRLDGLAGDYLSLMRKELGLRFEFVPARDLVELKRRVAANEVDLVAAAMPADFDAQAMVFSRPYERFPEVIVAHLRGPAIAGSEDLRGKKVAVREEAGLIGSLRLMLPRTELVPVASNDAGLRMVEKGDVSAYIGTLPAIDALIRDRYAATLRVVAPAGLDQDITFGVSRNNAHLAALIDEVIAGVRDNQKQAIRSRWLRANYNYGVPWDWVLLGLAIVTFIAIIIGVSYKRMRDAEARARAAEQRLVDINENLPGVVIRIYVDSQNAHTYEYVSGPTMSMFGMSPEDILSGHARPLDAAIDDDVVNAQEVIARCFRLSQPAVVEFRTWVRGSIRWIRVLGGEPKSTDKAGHFWSLYCADVTVEKEQELALKEAKETAEAAVAAKGAFLAMMSHEIRTPMAGVLGLVELLSKTKLTTEQSHMVDMAQDSAVALLRILDDILDFSRIEAEKLELEPVAFDLRLLTDSAIGTFAALAQKKHVRLYLVLDWRLASEYRGDANRLRQIINNLISNALKFTASGHVKLRVSLVDEVKDGQRLRFTVADTGIGISPDQLNRLFQPFTQAETSTTRRFGGTGLGLTICRQLARKMGGDVRLDSRVGQGTRATIELPLEVLQEASVIPGMAGKRALICTRDGMLELELANALSAMGLSVIEADTEEVAEFVKDDADIYIADTRLITQGVTIQGIPVIHLLPDTDPRGFYREDEKVMLCGSPLLWRSTVEACRVALGLRSSNDSEGMVMQSEARSARILVAEDHPINRAVIERQLNLLGYTCTMAEDGQRAWEALVTSHYDLLLTDCHMPVLDGYALSRRIRSKEAMTNTHIPIIALSASALPEQVELCRQAGMDDFLAKPVQLEELRRKIEMITRGLATTVPVEGEVHGNQLSYLMNVFGSKEQVQTLLEGMLKVGRSDVAKLDEAMASGDIEMQRDLLHRLDGSLRLVGITVTEANSTCDMSERRDAVIEQLDRIQALTEKLCDRP
ncbi:ATP-binding protein [Dyella japonica]|nr:transporter substrate-binding domain-containing protein [Dyella japonica]